MERNMDAAISEARRIMRQYFRNREQEEVRGNSKLSYADHCNLYEEKEPEELKYRLSEIRGVYKGTGPDRVSLLIQTEDGEKSVCWVDETMLSDSIGIGTGEKVSPGNPICVIALQGRLPNLFLALTLIREGENDLFTPLDHNLYQKALAIIHYYLWFREKPGKKLSVSNMHLGETYSTSGEAQLPLVTSVQEMQLKYALCKPYYLPETQRAIEQAFRDPEVIRHSINQKLRYLLNINPSAGERRMPDRQTMQCYLDGQLYGLEDAKRELISFLISSAHTKKHGMSLLIVGDHGTGKTALARAVAQLQGRPLEVIELGGLKNGLELEGLDSGFHEADAGRVTRAYFQHRTTEISILFENADKIKESSEDNPAMILQNMLKGRMEDKFLACPLSTENTTFIVTATDNDALPEELRKCFDLVLQLKPHTREEQIAIAKKHILPALLEKYELPTGSILFPKHTLETILENYCADSGVVDLGRNMEIILRRMLSGENSFKGNVVTECEARAILAPLTEETPALCFARHRDEYSPEVAEEIRRNLEHLRVVPDSREERAERDQSRLQLSYLLACRLEKGDPAEVFDPVKFADVLHRHLFGMDKVIREATVFYHTSVLQGNGLRTNLALVGQFGIGKSAVVRLIAEGMNYRYVRIALNGVSDVRVLKGFSDSYAGSDAGVILQGVREAGSLRTVFQLDELDKLSPEVANALIDLLDRNYVDHYLGVPVDFSDSVFIATANDWSKVPPVLRDRFIVLHLDGYSREEKSHIVSDYVIPRLEESYAAAGVQIAIDPEAEHYLLETYCPGYGVRDAEKAVQRIVGDLLVKQSGREDALRVRITKTDIRDVLGEEPIERGNFPERELPGITRALAVSEGRGGSSFAVETLLFDGEEKLELTGLPGESTSESVKIAVSAIRRTYPELLKGKGLHVHFGEGAVPKDGPSAGVAIYMSILSAALGKPIGLEKPYDVAYTGEISLSGGVFAVGGVMEKIQAADDAGCKLVFLPAQNYERLDREKLSQYICRIVPVTEIAQVAEQLFPELGKTPVLENRLL
ncbi:MAG: AAA family ATPase [Lachnospiraceae bacterium]|nr:AAA family ATPase [Lachnospiraceae bacterium]